MQIYAKFSNLVYKILKSRLQNSQISSPLSFRIPLSGIPNGRMLHVILNGRMLHVILNGRMLHVILTERMLHVILNGRMLHVILTERMLHVILTERGEWKDLIALGLLPSKKSGMEKRSC